MSIVFNLKGKEVHVSIEPADNNRLKVTGWVDGVPSNSFLHLEAPADTGDKS